MASYRKTSLGWWITLLVGWLLAIGSLLTITNGTDGENVATIYRVLSETLWSWRALLIFFCALIVFPEIIAYPFRLPADTSFASGWMFDVNTVARIYYFVFCVGVGIAASWFWSGSQVVVQYFAVSFMMQILPPVALGVIAALTLFVAFHFHYLLNRGDITIWILVAFLATIQMLLLSWIDLSVPFLFALAIVSLPTTTLLLSQWQDDLAPRRSRIFFAMLLFLITTGIGVVMYSLSVIQWKWLSTLSAFALLCLAFLLVIIHSRQQGYLGRLYQRARFRRPTPILFGRMIEHHSQWSGILLLTMIAIPLMRIAISAANVIGRVAIVSANIVLLSSLVVIVSLVRVPEIIGASMLRLRYALAFYLDAVVLPMVAFASAGVGIAFGVSVLTAYLLLGTPVLGFSLLATSFVIFLGIILGYSSLYRLSVSVVSTTYFVTEDPAVPERTPVTYFVSLLMLFWVIKFLGLLITLFIFRNLAPLFMPGFFFVAASIVIGIGVLLLGLLILRRR